MLIRIIALVGALATHAPMTFAQSNAASVAPKPKPIAALYIGERQIELLAVSQRARHDTALRQNYLFECKSMSKVLPGYPQPAFVSFDLRLQF